MSFIHAPPGTGGAHGWGHYTGASVSLSFQDRSCLSHAAKGNKLSETPASSSHASA